MLPSHDGGGKQALGTSSEDRPRAPRSPMRLRPRGKIRVLPAVLTLFVLVAGPLAAQDDPTQHSLREDRIRVGLMLGGTGLVGLVTEYQRGDWSAEIILGTITFREVSVAVSGKRYLSTGRLRPAIGAGIWSLTAWTEDGSGSVLVFRAPIAADWRFAGGNHMGIEIGLNRALAVNRLDPEDDTPPSDRLIPFPGLYYRFGWDP